MFVEIDRSKYSINEGLGSLPITWNNMATSSIVFSSELKKEFSYQENYVSGVSSWVCA
jgi:hypothetical protein